MTGSSQFFSQRQAQPTGTNNDDLHATKIQQVLGESVL
jgi:hypothetical protein